MSQVLIRHKVADYASWKPAYDAQAQDRLEAGCTSDMVMQDENDPNMVTILFDWNDLEEAHTFAQSEELKNAMQTAGVQGMPEIYFMEQTH